MKNRETTEWQEKLIMSGSWLPEIDVSDRVMEAIRNKKRLEPRAIPFKWRMGKSGYIAFIAAAVVFACGFGYAALSWKLFGSDGSIALELRSISPHESTVELIDPSLLERLGEGEAAIFYLRDQDRYIGLANERQYGPLAFEQFAAETGAHEPLSELGDGFVFTQGTIRHDLNKIPPDLSWGDPDGEERVSLRKIPIGAANGYTAKYQDAEGHQLTLTAWYNVPDREIYTDELDRLMIEKVTINEMESFYMKEKDSSVQRISWMEGEGEQHIYYQIFDTSADKLPREQLIEVAAKVMEQSSI
ncbi:hypothetical protein ACX1C1_11065 [Paenibacillus sp. strain BS8-2]